MKITRAHIRTIRIPLLEPFTVSFGTITERVSIIVSLETDSDIVGYGECPSLHFPSYVPDFTSGEREVLREFIIPAILGKDIETAQDLVALYSFVKGHNFAKTAVESAFWHILSQKNNVSLKSLFGGVREKIEVGESLGIRTTVEETIEEVSLRISEGFKRIKIKTKRGWDLQLLDAIRAKYPEVPLMVDGNSDYSLEQMEQLKKFDAYNLMMIEQPLAYNDIVDHSVLQRELKTPICLDESILDAEDARKALSLGSCRIINIKPGRVGGPLEVMKIHDLCQRQSIPVWCGGLLETGIGRAFNIALASLPNFTLPADMSETRLFFAQDLVKDPYKTIKGEIAVPDKPGLGFDIDEIALRKYTADTITLSQ